MKTLYIVTYNNSSGQGYYHNGVWTDGTSLECITDNFKEWLAEHNSLRKEWGETEESADEFDVQEMTPIIYNKGE